jgi:hypothetical protein
MIITDKFILLNFPKTGSTFARTAIKTIYGKENLFINNLLQKTGLISPGIFELLLPKICEGKYDGIVDQHGKYRQIPKKYLNRPILTVIRNPFSRYVSRYFYRWWVKFPPTDIPTILQYFPTFPDLTFPEFYEFNFKFNRTNHFNGIIPQIELGAYSLYFIQFFSKDPDNVLRTINEDYFNEDPYQTDFNHIHFIHQENLRTELKEFLKQIGFHEKRLEVIDKLEMINTTKYPGDIKNFMTMYSDALIEKIIRHEKLLFSIFPEYLP